MNSGPLFDGLSTDDAKAKVISHLESLTLEVTTIDLFTFIDCSHKD